MEREIENKRAQLTASQQRLYSIKNEIKQNEDHLCGHQRHQKQLQIKVRTANAEIADLENMEEHQSADVHILETTTIHLFFLNSIVYWMYMGHRSRGKLPCSFSVFSSQQIKSS